jgi:predicted O-linked N-acetylglucosamine transferase (SPINDLY family)
VLSRLLRSLRRTSPAQDNEAGIRLLGQNRLEEARRHFERALAADPKYASAWSNLGVLLWQLRRGAESIAHFRQAVALDPDNADAHVNLGEALTLNEVPEEAVAVLEEALRRDPANSRAHALLLRPLLQLCEWPKLEREVRLLIKAWERDPQGGWLKFFQPHTALLLPLPPALQREIAVRQAHAVRQRAAGLRAPGAPPFRGEGRLRLGYVSGDFRHHATAHLIAGLFERHDRSRFEVLAYSFGRDDGSVHRARIAAGVDRFVDVAAEPFDATAARIARDGVHILVDLMGYTGRSRPEIFALRAAPIQVSYLGYPGTMGADFIDYIVADREVIPAEDRRWFSEQVVWMPASYQVNDDRQAIAEAPSRDACGLPASAFVFCAFNGHIKIDRRSFDAWMRILAAVPGSVLWLLAGPGERRLREAAAAHGIEPDRLVFAPHLAKEAHLARHRQADLFLDTGGCNAHTTASDALWAGLPVLTCPGPTFAGRVGASLLRAVGLPELIASDWSAYEARAVELARRPEPLAALRAKLATNRLQAPLFDTAGYARALESGYQTMWQRHASGAAPAAFSVA